MHKLIRKVVKELKQDIVDVRKTDEDLKKVLSLLPKAAVWVDKDINVNLATSSMSEVKEVLKSFAKNGIHLERHIPDDAQPHWILKGKNVKILFNPIWSSKEGLACRLVQIGEYVQTTPKYKLVCDED